MDLKKFAETVRIAEARRGGNELFIGSTTLKGVAIFGGPGEQELNIHSTDLGEPEGVDVFPSWRLAPSRQVGDLFYTILQTAEGDEVLFNDQQGVATVFVGGEQALPMTQAAPTPADVT